MSLMWHGVLLSTPHHHVDSTVPQEVLACSASHPSSQAKHLHGSGQVLSPQPCLACLAGSTVAEAAETRDVETVPVVDSPVVAALSGLRSGHHAHLPLLRGPPVAA